MTELSFYHLQRQRLEQALPELLEKVLQRGLRAVVLTGSPERAEALAAELWTQRRESFLPHGTRADGKPGRQPIWLTELEENPNGATVLVAVDGVRLAFAGGFERCLDLFDGADAAAVAEARRLWQEARQAGHRITYWQQSERGAWERKTEA